MERIKPFNSNKTITANQYLGVWVTRDGYIRHQFLPNGRYVEARGENKNAYAGYYSVLGNHVEYLDDTGFTAEGDFIDGAFFHAGMVFYKEQI